MLHVQQVIRHVSEPGGPHADPHRREAVQLQPVWQEVHAVGSSEVPPERAFWRAAVRLHVVLQELHRQVQSQVAREEVSPQRLTDPVSVCDVVCKYLAADEITLFMILFTF